MSPRNSISGAVLVMLLLSWLPCTAISGENQPSADSGSRENNPLIQFYQRVISPVDGDRCSMYPSCSTYAGTAMRNHGFFIGWIMACDRLMRCGGDEIKTASQVYRGGRKFIPDPVQNNDFWWTRRSGK